MRNKNGGMPLAVWAGIGCVLVSAPLKALPQEMKLRGVFEAGHTNWIVSLAFNPNGKVLASASKDKSIKIWDLTIGKEAATLRNSGDGFYSVAFSPDGKYLAGGAYGSIAIWEMPSGKSVTTLKGQNSGVLALAFNADGKKLVSANGDKIAVWDMETKKKAATLSGHRREVRSVAISPDGKTIASGSYDATLKLWEVGSGKNISTLEIEGRNNVVTSVAFSPDGKLLASASEDVFGPQAVAHGITQPTGGSIKLWDVTTRKCVSTMQTKKGIQSVAFNFNGNILASASKDKTIQLWDVATAKPITTLEGHNGWVFCAVFSPDGRTLASSGRDGTIKLWEILLRQENVERRVKTAITELGY